MSGSPEKRWRVYTGVAGGVAIYTTILPILIQWLYSDETADCFKSGVVSGKQMIDHLFFGSNGVDPDDLVPREDVQGEDECTKAYHAGYNIGVTTPVIMQALSVSALVAFLGYRYLPRHRKEQTA